LLREDKKDKADTMPEAPQKQIDLEAQHDVSIKMYIKFVNFDNTFKAE
jgi:hypothetical protein